MKYDREILGYAIAITLVFFFFWAGTKLNSIFELRSQIKILTDFKNLDMLEQRINEIESAVKYLINK